MVAFDRRKVPESQHWEELSRLSDFLMTPQDFLYYWDVSLLELAKITGVSLSTVEHWFCRGSRSQQPKPYHMFKLALVHKRWSRL